MSPADSGRSSQYRSSVVTVPLGLVAETTIPLFIRLSLLLIHVLVLRLVLSVPEGVAEHAPPLGVVDDDLETVIVKN